MHAGVAVRLHQLERGAAISAEASGVQLKKRSAMDLTDGWPNMTSDNNLQVTFSKHRVSLFKKASDLCTLCSVEIAIIVFSPKNKPFSFGHQSIKSIVDRFLNCAPPTSVETHGAMLHLVEAHRNASVREFNT
ncbi:agamous-like MADS-box protein AGL62 [Malania oleifera]|uniref:agamous-like MADS-box protein AGL62 n=1 Tax=Malania oleifera TaxID=397392 RepID=UPI0025AE7A55|nr:agamous-like MADS-box protein AGL62 [Malania oleifera]